MVSISTGDNIWFKKINKINDNKKITMVFCEHEYSQWLMKWNEYKIKTKTWHVKDVGMVKICQLINRRLNNGHIIIVWCDHKLTLRHPAGCTRRFIIIYYKILFALFGANAGTVTSILQKPTNLYITRSVCLNFMFIITTYMHNDYGYYLRFRYPLGIT